MESFFVELDDDELAMLKFWVKADNKYRALADSDVPKLMQRSVVDEYGWQASSILIKFEP